MTHVSERSYKLDLDGDLNYNEASELDDTGTFNGINELTERNTDSTGGVEYTLTYNKRGDTTDDGEDYTYIYDAFGRLREVKTRGGSPLLVEEHRYNGLGQRIAWHFDVDADGTVDNHLRYPSGRCNRV